MCIRDREYPDDRGRLAQLLDLLERPKKACLLSRLASIIPRLDALSHELAWALEQDIQKSKKLYAKALGHNWVHGLMRR